MKIEIYKNENETIIQLNKIINTANEAEFADAVWVAFRIDKPIIIDFTFMTYGKSTFYGILLSLFKVAKERNLKIIFANANADVRNMLYSLNLNKLFKFKNIKLNR